MDNNINPFLKQKGPKIEDLEQLTCSECGNAIFDMYYRMYRLSALESPTGKSQVFNVPVYVCAGCSNILDIKKLESTPKAAVEKVDDKLKETKDE